MHALANPSGFLCALWEVQEGKCFHCDKPMVFIATPGAMIGNYATREHVYPVSRHPYLCNNVVLAHKRCNNTRGDISPTHEEHTKAANIYRALGLTAFVEPRFYLQYPAFRAMEDKTKSKVAEEAGRRFQAKKHLL